jgi:hypothetical protein
LEKDYLAILAIEDRKDDDEEITVNKNMDKGTQQNKSK